jgi:transcriptional regulator with XRE-family HTH domain
MSDPTSQRDPHANSRLRELLAELSQQFDTQQEIATRAGLTPQLLADLKQGRRPLTELVARRLADEYGVDFAWLLGRSDVKQPGLARTSGGMRLPCSRIRLLAIP